MIKTDGKPTIAWAKELAVPEPRPGHRHVTITATVRILDTSLRAEEWREIVESVLKGRVHLSSWAGDTVDVAITREEQA